MAAREFGGGFLFHRIGMNEPCQEIAGGARDDALASSEG
jgi:hypothetical protein